MRSKKLTLTLLALLTCIPSFADREYINGLYYVIFYDLSYEDLSYYNYRAEVARNPGCSGDIVIPSTVTYNGVNCPVTSIGDSAFEDCSGLTSISIPNSVTYIGSAFAGCYSLTSINIPSSVTSIEPWAFANCSSLTSIDIPNNVTHIGYQAFSGCSSLTSITIPNSVIRILQGNAFPNCSALTSINVEVGNPNYDSRDNCNAIIETASNKLLTGCKNTVIPNSVTSIGDYAFAGCSGLTSITIPNSVTSIGGYAFRECI